jgi:ribonuclease D
LCDPDLYRFDPESDFRRVRGAGSLTPQGLAVLRELTILRDQGAREHNIPSRSFLRDEVLIDLSRSPAKSVEKLAKVRGLPRPVEAEYGSQIVAATLRALALPSSQHPEAQQTDSSPSERFAADALWAAAQCLCIGQRIDPNLVTSRAEIGELHRHLSNRGEAPTRLLNGWRKNAVGEPLVNLFRGAAPISLTWSGSRLKATVAE